MKNQRIFIGVTIIIVVAMMLIQTYRLSNTTQLLRETEFTLQLTKMEMDFCKQRLALQTPIMLPCPSSTPSLGTFEISSQLENIASKIEDAKTEQEYQWEMDKIERMFDK